MTSSWEKMTERMLKGVSEEDILVFEKVAGLISKNIEQMLNDEEWKNERFLKQGEKIP